MTHTIKKIGLTISGAMLLFIALFAQTCALLIAKTCALLFAKKCALLFTDYNPKAKWSLFRKKLAVFRTWLLTTKARNQKTAK